jgi:hypothetical protein
MVKLIKPAVSSFKFFLVKHLNGADEKCLLRLLKMIP